MITKFETQAQLDAARAARRDELVTERVLSLQEDIEAGVDWSAEELEENARVLDKANDRDNAEACRIVAADLRAKA